MNHVYKPKTDFVICGDTNIILPKITVNKVSIPI
jgi:hypothetical protein